MPEPGDFRRLLRNLRKQHGRPTTDEIVAELHARASILRREQARAADRPETATTAAAAEHAAAELERLAVWISGGAAVPISPEPEAVNA